MQQRKATVRQSAVDGQVWIGYWVQTAGLGSRAAADKVKARLVRGGMPDVYVLPDSNYRISLGVFRKKASADTVEQQARQLGFETRLIERYQPGKNYWLYVRLPASEGVQTSDFPSVSGQILRIEKIPCDDDSV